MKTKEISTLKKELLIIEAKNESIAWAMIFNKWGSKEVLKWTLLGKPDEIKEEDVRSLVSDFDAFENSKYYYLHGFWKLIEKEIYWVNPEPKLSGFLYFLPSINEGVKLQKSLTKPKKRPSIKKEL